VNLPPNTLKIALAEMLVEGGQKAATLQRAEPRIVEAARNGAQVEALLFADIHWLPRPARGDGWETLWQNRNPRVPWTIQTEACGK
jgi:hypothetical protein